MYTVISLQNKEINKDTNKNYTWAYHSEIMALGIWYEYTRK